MMTMLGAHAWAHQNEKNYTEISVSNRNIAFMSIVPQKLIS